MAFDKSYNLPYSHDEVKHLFAKIAGGYILSKDEYDKVIEILNLERISTFSGNYEDLEGKPDLNQYVLNVLVTGDYITGDELERVVRDSAETLYSNIMGQVNEADGEFANKVELENMADSITTQYEAYVTSKMSSMLNKLLEYGTKEELLNKADKYHSHSLDEIQDLYYEINSRSKLDHDHDRRYASILSEHEHENKAALDKITSELIDEWNDMIYEYHNELNSIKVQIEHIDEEGHVHNNMDTINRIFPEDVKRWDEMNLFDTENKLTTADIGGISEGADLSGLTIQNILKRILYPDKKWVVTASIVLDKQGYLFEKGTTVSVKQIVVDVIEQGTNSIKELTFYINGKVYKIMDFPDSTQNKFVCDIKEGDAVLSESVAEDYFRIQLKDSTDLMTKANTAKVDFHLPCYFGITTQDVIPDEATIKNTQIFKKVIAGKSNQTHSFTMSRECAVFVYPESYGELVSILDPNGFEQSNGFTRHTISLTGIDGSEGSYYMYIGPSNTNKNFKLTFKF